MAVVVVNIVVIVGKTAATVYLAVAVKVVVWSLVVRRIVVVMQIAGTAVVEVVSIITREALLAAVEYYTIELTPARHS
jgi:hypothetical protein